MNKDRFFLGHIRDEINFLEEQFRKTSLQDLMEDPVLQRASVRSLEIVGEAVKNLSEDFKLTNPQIEWREIAGLRDKLVHHYFGVDWDIVWEVIRDRLPELKKTIVDALK